MADSVSKTGVYVEQDENGQEVAVVESAPARGVQLVAAGGTVTPDLAARIDAVKAGIKGDAVRGGPLPVANTPAKSSK